MVQIVIAVEKGKQLFTLFSYHKNENKVSTTEVLLEVSKLKIRFRLTLINNLQVYLYGIIRTRYV